jgi:hypothetical protein
MALSETKPIDIAKPQSHGQGASIRIGTGAKFGFPKDPEYLFINDDQNGLILSATFSDGAFIQEGFDFPFPYFQMAFSDPSGFLAERIPMLESLSMAMSFGKFHLNESISHDFYWTQDQIHNTNLSDHISGSHVWAGVSRYRKLDGLKSKSFGISSAFARGVPLKNVIHQIASAYTFSSMIIDGYNIPGSGIQNEDLWYQANENDFDFIGKHTTVAYNSDASPYLSFINLKNEFYFDSLKNLESQKVLPNLNFKMEQGPGQNLDPDQIQYYDVIHMGVPQAEKYYSSQFYGIQASGSYLLNETTTKQFFNSPTLQPGEPNANARRKILTRNQDMALNLRNVQNLGIIDNKNQLVNFKGRVAHEHTNALTLYRLNIVIHFNADCVSGRTLSLDFKDAADLSRKSMYAGKWLIIGTHHSYDNQSRSMVTSVNLMRSGLTLSPASKELQSLVNDL